jgi:hypothetical protein
MRRKRYLDRSRTRLVRNSEFHGVLVITSSALTSNQRGVLVTHLVPRYTTIAAWVSDGHGMVARWGNHHRDSPWFTMWINEILRRRSPGPIRPKSVLHLDGTNHALDLKIQCKFVGNVMQICADSRRNYDARPLNTALEMSDPRSSHRIVIDSLDRRCTVLN